MPLVIACEVDTVELGAAAAALRIPRSLAEIHENAAVGSPGRPLNQKAVGQLALAAPIRVSPDLATKNLFWKFRYSLTGNKKALVKFVMVSKRQRRRIPP